MRSSLSDTDVRREWGQLQRRAKRDPGVVYAGYRTGQFAVHYDPSVGGVQRAFVKAVVSAGVGDGSLVYYHPVVHWTSDDGGRVQRREQFRHPIPAHDWLLETVPDFDLLETVYLNVPDGDSEPASADG